jgi:hypothetical protein
MGFYDNLVLTSDTWVFTTRGDAAEGQDKDRQNGDRSASIEAYREKAASRSNTRSTRSEEIEGDPYALVPLTLQCRRYVKREIHEIARRRSVKQKVKISDSSVGAELLEQMVHHKANVDHTAFLEPTLTRLFEQKFTEFFDRYLGLTARNTYKLHLIFEILANFVPIYIGEAAFSQVLQDAETSKRVDITRQSEQMREVFNLVKQEVYGWRKEG